MLKFHCDFHKIDYSYNACATCVRKHFCDLPKYDSKLIEEEIDRLVVHEPEPSNEPLVYNHWFVSFWVIKGDNYGAGNCVFRQTSNVFQIKEFQDAYKTFYEKNFPGDWHFRVLGFQPITEEEFCRNGEIAFTLPEKEFEKM